MSKDTNEITRLLSRHALAVCQTYLPNGRKTGNHWIIGNLSGDKGRSMHVRLHGPDYGPGAAGKWADRATGEHGDLLDIIAAANGGISFPETLDEARRFLSLPRPNPPPPALSFPPSDHAAKAMRLFRSGKNLHGTHAERYLRGRAITASLQYAALRFHPNCYYREDDDAPLQAFPALLAAITDLSGTLTGVNRTWLDPATPAQASILDPRRAMGRMLGHGVRFGVARDVLIAGEGLETMLSIRSLLPWIPAVSALTADHLALLRLPLSLRRLYVALDNDPAGDMAWASLSRTARAQGTAAFPLIPALDDWNGDLRQLGFAASRNLALSQLHPDDIAPALSPLNRSARGEQSPIPERGTT